MGAPGVQMKFQQRIAVMDVQPFKMGAGVFAVLFIYFPQDCRAFGPGNGQGDCACIRRNAVHNGQIGTADILFLKLPGQ